MRKLVTISFPEDLLTALDVRSEEDGKKRSSLVLHAVRRFLDGPNGPKEHSEISPELIEWGHQICEDLLEDMKKLLSPESPTTVDVETPDIRNQSCLIITEEVPIEEIKEKIKASRGTCSECGSINYQHFRDCKKRKK